MKNKGLILMMICGMIWFSACNGDHAAHSNPDTVKNRYGQDNDTTKAADRNIDTGKITTTTGDASDLDNSASGGTKMAKDTISKKPIKK